ncbi:MAG TPA: beta-N-acetylglucosaminidase [Leeuwenhoekiella sp.]|nr:beta-N-acetylglucosaminidase [Leeuwenhoekiella sp.]
MRIFLLSCCFFIVLSCGSDQPVIHPETAYSIIPQPVSILPGSGFFEIDHNTIVVGAVELEAETAFITQLLDQASGYSIAHKMGTATETRNKIILSLDDTLTNPEGYMIDITSNGIEVIAKKPAGIMYAIQTLRQLLPPEGENKIIKGLKIPAVEIEDYPRYAYRGMHLDVSRHFFPVDFVKKYIDLLALHKMNIFHWHLTDDQGWRIEIKKYPKLTEVGGFRNGTVKGHRPYDGSDNQRYGGFYTQDEVRDVVTYAEKKHITIIPEIEMPGHASAAIAAYPYLSCFPEEPTIIPEDIISTGGKQLQAEGTPKIVQETWGVFDDVFCAGDDTTFEFLEDVLDEVIPLFPSEYIHIGGDECPKENWKRCPDCQKRMKEMGLTDEHELQSYFIQRIEKYLNTKGKKIIGWDEILEGGLAPNATVMSWRGEDGGIDAAKQSHQVIMTPTTYCYLDYYQFKADAGKSTAVGNYLPVQKVYEYNPFPEELTAEQAEYIQGAQANVWTEYMPTEEYVEYKVLPRMTALAEVVWVADSVKNWSSFKSRLERLSERYRVLGYNYAKVDPDGEEFIQEQPTENKSE